MNTFFKKITPIILLLTFSFSILIGCNNEEKTLDQYPLEQFLSSNIEQYNFSEDINFNTNWSIYYNNETQDLCTTKIVNLNKGDNFFIINDGSKSKIINLYRKHICHISCKYLDINSVEQKETILLPEANIINDYIGIEKWLITEKEFNYPNLTIKSYYAEANTKIVVNSNIEIQAVYKKLKDGSIYLDYNGGVDSNGNTRNECPIYHILPNKLSFLIFDSTKILKDSILPYKNNKLPTSFDYNDTQVLIKDGSNRWYSPANGINIEDYFGLTLYANYNNS